MHVKNLAAISILATVPKLGKLNNVVKISCFTVLCQDFCFQPHTCCFKPFVLIIYFYLYLLVYLHQICGSELPGLLELSLAALV